VALPDPVVRYLRTLAAIEREAALADDTPPWLLGLLGAVDPQDLQDHINDRCPTCGQHSVHADLVGGFVDGARRMSMEEDRQLTRGERRLVSEIRTIS